MQSGTIICPQGTQTYSLEITLTLWVMTKNSKWST